MSAPIPDLDKYSTQYINSLGGIVYLHQEHGEGEREANIVVARMLADLLNVAIYLLPTSNIPGTRNADAMIEDQHWEFKTNYAATGTSIDTAVREAYKQARRILLHLTVPMDTAVLENALYGRVRKCHSLLTVCVLLDGQLFSFDKADILSQRFRGIIKGKGSPT